MFSSTRFGLALAAGHVAASVTGVARAAEVVARGPHGCPDAGELTFRVERRMNMPLAQAAPLRFDVTMEQATSGHRARIEVTPRGWRRELAAPDCEELAEAVSIAIALALGNVATPSADGAESDAHDTTALPQPSEPARTAAAATGVAHTGDAATRPGEDAARQAPPALAGAFPEASVSVWMLADAGSLPSPAAGVGLGIEAAWRRLELRVLATLLFEQEVEVESTLPERVGARLGLWTGSALGCTLPWGERAALRPFACLGLEVGRLSGEGTGVSDPLRGGALWLAPQVHVGAAWAIPDSALRLQVALLGAAPLNRDEFTLRGIGAVHQPSPWIGRLSAGVAFDL